VTQRLVILVATSMLSGLVSPETASAGKQVQSRWLQPFGFAQSSVGKPPKGLHLTLTRAYGRAIYRECELHVGVYEGRGAADLWCEPNTVETLRPRWTARLNLTGQEIAQLEALFAAAKLYGGGHVGCDGRSQDGLFETLKVDTNDGTVVLVTRCNASFDDQSARRELLALLRTIEARLLAGDSR
jgi:hypothetical protein